MKIFEFIIAITFFLNWDQEHLNLNEAKIIKNVHWYILSQYKDLSDKSWKIKQELFFISTFYTFYDVPYV